MTAQAHSPPCLLSLGSVNADFEVRVAEPPGRTETQAGRGLRRLGGGKAANVALLARRLGCPSLLIGRVGDDDLAHQALAPLREAGVALHAVRRAAGEGTAVSMILVPPDGKKHIVLAGEANLGHTPEDIAAIEAAVRHAPAGSLLAADCEIAPRAFERALAAAAQRGMRVVVDPSFPQAVPRAALRCVHALTPNAAEALQLAGIDAAEDDEHALAVAADALQRLGPRVVCIKRSDGGCLLRDGAAGWRLDAAPVPVADTTGAGDAFTGAFAVGLLEGLDMLDAARLAVAASELAVTAFGSQPAYPDRARLLQQLHAARRGCTRWPLQ